MARKDWKEIPSYCSQDSKPIPNKLNAILMVESDPFKLRAFCRWECVKKFAQNRIEIASFRVDFSESWLNEQAQRATTRSPRPDEEIHQRADRAEELWQKYQGNRPRTRVERRQITELQLPSD